MSQTKIKLYNKDSQRHAKYIIQKNFLRWQWKKQRMKLFFYNEIYSQWDSLSKDDQIIHGLGSTVEYLPKRFAELRVEDGVDDRIEEGVDVPEPGGEDESGHSWRERQVELVADGT